MERVSSLDFQSVLVFPFRYCTGIHGESKFFSLPVSACVPLQVLSAMQSVISLVSQSLFVFSVHLLKFPLFISEETNFIFILYSRNSLQIYRNVVNSRYSKQSVTLCTDAASSQLHPALMQQAVSYTLQCSKQSVTLCNAASNQSHSALMQQAVSHTLH